MKGKLCSFQLILQVTTSGETPVAHFDPVEERFGKEFQFEKPQKFRFDDRQNLFEAQQNLFLFRR